MPSFTFYENIPQATDVISQSQPQLLQNFSSIDSILDVDHYTFESAGGDDGFHRKVTFPLIGSSVLPVGAVGIVNTQTANSKSELFYLNSTENIQITNSGLVKSSGEGMLPGGLLIKCGSGTGNTPVTYVTSFPTTVLSITITAFANARTWDVASLVPGSGVTGFVPQPSSGGGGVFFWMAIGY